MEDAKNSTIVLDMLGFLAMLSAIRLPPGFAPKWRCGGLGLGESSSALGLHAEGCMGRAAFSNFLSALIHPDRRSSRPKKGCPEIMRLAGNRADTELGQPLLV